MRRIKIMLAVVSAVATMAAMASPAMAQTNLFVPNADCPTLCFTGTSSGVGDDFFDDGDGILVFDDGNAIPLFGFDDGDVVGGQSFDMSRIESGPVGGGTFISA
jgi:hypothetical protein